MATRLPVVMVNGQLQQLQATDALPLFSAAVQGEVPASGSATGTKVIYDDGVWRVPTAAPSDLSNLITANDAIAANKSRTIAEELVIRDADASAILIDVTTNPQTFAAGTWPKAAMETGRWRVVMTPTKPSTQFAGGWTNNEVIVATDDGLGGNELTGLIAGGTDFQLVPISLVYRSGQKVFASSKLSFVAGQPITITVDCALGYMAIDGATIGNGIFHFPVGVFAFDAAQPLGIGINPNEANTITATMSDVTDAAWAAVTVALSIGSNSVLKVD